MEVLRLSRRVVRGVNWAAQTHQGPQRLWVLRALALPPHEGAASAAVSSGKVLGTSIIAPGREGSQSGLLIIACATVGSNGESRVRNVAEILSAAETMLWAVGIVAAVIVGALVARPVIKKRLSQKQKAGNGSVTINVSASDGGQHATTRSKDAPAKEHD